MFDIKFIRQNPDKVRACCKKKGIEVDVNQLLALDEKRRKLIQEVEGLRSEQNKFGKEDIKKGKELKNKIKKIEPELEKIEKEFHDLMCEVPNLPCEDVPIGKDERDNVILREVGKKTEFKFKPKDYLEISEKLYLIDTKRAAKVSGSRFGYLKKEAVLLEFALINLAFDVLTKEGFIPAIPPVMLKEEMAKGMGYLEQTDEKEAYYIPKDNLYLVGTAEQSIGVMYSDEIIKEEYLPKRYVAFSTCFRREAGAHGKDTRGILRVHQFDKVEMFSFCRPENSKKEHQLFLSLEEKLMKLLKIPYRVVQLCSGDLSRPSTGTFDIESWMPGQGRYRETHSTSNCTDYQSRRLNIRYRDPKTKKIEFVHTVNGTAFAIPRILIAIIENYQQKDGTVKVPAALQKYVNFKVIK